MTENLQEHQDLEERQYIGTTVEFGTQGATFSGLPVMEIEMKVKKKPERIEQRENARRKSNSELF